MALVSQDGQSLTIANIAPFTGVNNGTARLLKAISATELAALQEGNAVYVESVRDYWKWLPTSTIASDDITYCAPTVVGASAGRFERLFIYSPDWVIQDTWAFSSAGNDENIGDAAHPLLTTNERRRRLGPNAQLLGIAYHYRYLSDNYTDIIEGQCPNANTVIYLHASLVDGQGASTIFPGAATTVGTFNTATNTPWAITSASIPVSWTSSGTVDQRIRLTSGANVGALSWVTLDQNGAAPNAKARMAEFLTPVASFNVAPFVPPAIATAGPSNGDTFVVESLRVLARVQIDLQATPANSSSSFRVVLDGIQTILTGTSRIGVYTDGSKITSGRTAFSVLSLHQCSINFLSDDTLKIIVGGYLPPGANTALCNNAAAISTFDRFTIQGDRRVLFEGSGGNFNGGINWTIGQIGTYDTTGPTLIFGIIGSNARFGSFVYYGTGNTGALISLLRNASPNITTNTFTQPIVTTSANQVFIDVNPTRISVPAFDQTTGLYTVPRLLSFANIQATVPAGGFDYSFIDPVTGAGFVKY